MTNKAKSADHLRTIPDDPEEAYRLGFEDGVPPELGVGEKEQPT